MLEKDEVEVYSSPFPNEAEYIIQLLLENEIPCRIIVPNSDYNAYFGTSITASAHVKIAVKDIHFDQAIAILSAYDDPEIAEDAEKYRSEIEKLDNESLLEILSSHNKYPAAMTEMAGTILDERDHSLPEENEYIDEAGMMKPLSLGPWAITLWLCFAFAAAPIGIIMSIFVYFFKGETPSGKKYYLYNEKMRKLALFSLIVPSLIWIAITIWQIQRYSSIY